METYSQSVALFDFIPVALSATGLLLLARGISFRHPPAANIAWLGAILVIAGGLSKASWKLILASTGHAIPTLENLLFILMAPGFIAIAFALGHTLRAWQQPNQSASPPGVWLGACVMLTLAGGVATALLYPESRVWFFWLLAITTVANASLLFLAIRTSRWCSLRWPIAALFVYNFVATLALSGLARLPPTETTAWIQEGVNLTAQAALACGFWRLSIRMLEKP